MNLQSINRVILFITAPMITYLIFRSLFNIMGWWTPLASGLIAGVIMFVINLIFLIAEKRFKVKHQSPLLKGDKK